MLAVVKEPHIELSLGGEERGVAEMLKFLRSRYTIEVLVQSGGADDDETVNVRETDFWHQNATPGRKLAGYRLKYCLTQRQLAERSGIHHVVISAYENGKREISRKAAVRIAKALGEDADSFCARILCD